MVVTCTDGKYAVCTTCGSRQKINEESKNIMTNKKEETKEKIFEENILGEK